jgi:hypothetical protein
LGSAGAGETMKPTDRAHVAVTEGEGVITGLRKLEEETAFGRYEKAAQAGMGRVHVRPAEEKGRPVGLAGLRGRMGRLAAGPIGPKVKEKFFSEKNLIFDYNKALENCRRRFRRNFDRRIFPKFF